MTDRETSAALLERLRRHYIKPGAFPGGVFVPECGINGGEQTRADALYVGFTSTSGRLLVGHELKVSRADWRRELDKAGKADFWADNCHAWYVVAPSVDIVKPDELPHGWGLMLPGTRSPNRMEVKVKAAVRPERTPSWDAVRSIMARLDTLRERHDTEVRREAAADAMRRVTEAEAEFRRNTDRREMSPETQQRLMALERLENLLGVQLATWFAEHADRVHPETVAAALRIVEARDAMRLRAADYTSKVMREAGEKLLAGLDEYAAAMADLAAIEA